MTVNEGFRTFLSWLTPTTTESDRARSHRRSIEQCLRANYKVQSYFRSGSFGNGTSISGFSDVDYLVGIARDEIPSNSIYFLAKVRTTLDDRFPLTGVRVNSPAVKVPFGTEVSETLEIVPADYRGVLKGTDYRVYEIADGGGGWIQTSPDAHKDYVDAIDNKHGGKLKPLIRFIKAWKYWRDVPISSFYLELRTTKYAEGERALIYSLDVRGVLKKLFDVQLSAIQDPMQVSGYIHACETETNKEDALSKLETALGRAQRAVNFELNGNERDAFACWDLLYNGQFPAYR